MGGHLQKRVVDADHERPRPKGPSAGLSDSDTQPVRRGIVETVKTAVQQAVWSGRYPAELRNDGFSREEDLATVAREAELRQASRDANVECERVRAAVESGDAHLPKLEQARHVVTVASREYLGVEKAKARLWNNCSPVIATERAEINYELTELRVAQGERTERAETLEKRLNAAKVRLAGLMENGDPDRLIDQGKQAITEVEASLEHLRRQIGKAAKRMYELTKRRDALKREAWGLPPHAGTE
jgi:chromosome segregation ATPase